ncbi:unnamed protein product [Ectocarpus sp. 12 AP-2014]
MRLKFQHLPFCIVSLFVANSNGLESCDRISLSGSGPPDGVYETIVDYRGRPDFYREDARYNLYGEEEEDNASCYWRIDDVESEFHYYTADDCSFHPVDIESGWSMNELNLDPEAVSVQIVCAASTQSNAKLMLYLTLSLCSLVVIFLVVWMHLLIRSRRLKKAREECPVCRKEARDAACVVKSAFRSDNSSISKQ